MVDPLILEFKDYRTKHTHRQTHTHSRLCPSLILKKPHFAYQYLRHHYKFAQKHTTLPH